MVYYHASTIYSIFALSNANESVVERYRHTAYGQTTVLDADGTEDTDGRSDVENPYLFQSRRWEGAAGVMQFRHREYAPDLGRFLQRDPLALSVGSRRQAMEGTGELGEPVALYAFLESNPFRASDPLGLKLVKQGFWRIAKRPSEISVIGGAADHCALYVFDVERLEICEYEISPQPNYEDDKKKCDGSHPAGFSWGYTLHSSGSSSGSSSGKGCAGRQKECWSLEELGDARWAVAAHSVWPEEYPERSPEEERLSDIFSTEMHALSRGWYKDVCHPVDFDSATDEVPPGDEPFDYNVFTNNCCDWVDEVIDQTDLRDC